MPMTPDVHALAVYDDLVETGCRVSVKIADSGAPAAGGQSTSLSVKDLVHGDMPGSGISDFPHRRLWGRSSSRCFREANASSGRAGRQAN